MITKNNCIILRNVGIKYDINKKWLKNEKKQVKRIKCCYLAKKTNNLRWSKSVVSIPVFHVHGLSGDNC